MTPADWYEAEIKLETQIYGDPQRHPRLWVRPWKARYWPRRDFSQNLQVQMDRERFGVFLVQTLFLLVIGLLVIGR